MAAPSPTLPSYSFGCTQDLSSLTEDDLLVSNEFRFLHNEYLYLKGLLHGVDLSESSIETLCAALEVTVYGIPLYLGSDNEHFIYTHVNNGWQKVAGRSDFPHIMEAYSLARKKGMLFDQNLCKIPQDMVYVTLARLHLPARKNAQGRLKVTREKVWLCYNPIFKYFLLDGKKSVLNLRNKNLNIEIAKSENEANSIDVDFEGESFTVDMCGVGMVDHFVFCGTSNLKVYRGGHRFV